MKAVFLDYDGIIIHEEEMTQTPPFISIPYFGKGNVIVPGQKMKIAKVTIRLYRLLGFNDSKIIYQQMPKKELFAILQKQKEED